MGVIALRKDQFCVRDGDLAIKAQIGFEVRLRNYAITAALQAKICRVSVSFDYNPVSNMDLLDRNSTTA